MLFVHLQCPPVRYGIGRQSFPHLTSPANLCTPMRTRGGGTRFSTVTKSRGCAPLQGLAPGLLTCVAPTELGPRRSRCARHLLDAHPSTGCTSLGESCIGCANCEGVPGGADFLLSFWPPASTYIANCELRIADRPAERISSSLSALPPAVDSMWIGVRRAGAPPTTTRKLAK